MMQTKWIGLAGLLGAVVMGSALTAAAVEIRTVVLRNDEPPPGGGSWYVRFFKPTVGDVPGASVSFFAKARAFPGRKKGIYKEDPDGPGSTVVFVGDFDPGTGRQFRRLGNPSMNSGGEVAFDAYLTGNLKGVFRDDPNLVSLSGDPIPGVTGRLGVFSSTVMTDAGGVVFLATISEPAKIDGVDVNEGIFRCSGGDGNCSSGTGVLEVLALKNDELPDRPGRKLCVLERVSATNFGAAFLAETQTDCGARSEVPKTGIFRMPFGGSLVTIALEGESCEPEPGPAGTRYSLIKLAPHLTTDGLMVFKARTTGSTIKEVLYLCSPGSCPAAPAQAAVIQGDAAPLGPGMTFRSFGPPAISDAGDTVFKATVRGSSGIERGLFIRREIGTVETILMKGDAVPDLPGYEFWRFPLRTTAPIDMSRGGKIVFRAKVKRNLPPRLNQRGIFLVDTGS